MSALDHAKAYLPVVEILGGRRLVAAETGRPELSCSRATQPARGFECLL